VLGAEASSQIAKFGIPFGENPPLIFLIGIPI